MNDIVSKWLYDPLVGKAVALVAVVLAVQFIVRLLQRYAAHRVKNTDSRYRIRKLFAFLGYIIIFLAITIIFSDTFGSMTVAFGVAGAGIAFALQEVIASVAGWVAISFGGFYRIGDRVQLGGIMGDVIDIGVLRTTLMECGQWVKSDLYNGRIVRIANSFVFKEPVFNYSGDYPFLWDEISVPIKYGGDQALMRKILLDVANETVADYAESARQTWHEMVEKYRIEDARIDPLVFLVLTDNWMEFTLRYVVDYKKRRATKDILFSKILDEINRTEGKLAVASTTMHIVQAPPLELRIRQTGSS